MESIFSELFYHIEGGAIIVISIVCVIAAFIDALADQRISGFLGIIGIIVLVPAIVGTIFGMPYQELAFMYLILMVIVLYFIFTFIPNRLFTWSWFSSFIRIGRTCTSGFGKPKYKSTLIFPGVIFILSPVLGIMDSGYFGFWNTATVAAMLIVGVGMLITGICLIKSISDKQRIAQQEERDEIEARWKDICNKKTPLNDVLPSLEKYVTDYLYKYKFPNLYSDLSPSVPWRYVSGISDTIERLEKLKKVYPNNDTITRLLKDYGRRNEEILTPAELDATRRDFLR